MSGLSRRIGAATLALTGIAIGALPLAAQAIKPGLTHEDTYRWSSIRDRVLSPDGAWLAYVVRPWDGDPELVVTSTDGTRERSFRGLAPVFTDDSRYLAFEVPPLESVVDSLELEGKKGDDLPGDSLAVIALSDAFEQDGGSYRAGPIESFAVPDDGGAYVAYLLSESDDAESKAEAEEARDPEAGEGEEEEGPERSAEYEKRHEKKDGKRLVLRDLASGVEHTFEHVSSYVFSKNGARLAYAASTETDGDDGVYLVDPLDGTAIEVMSGEGHYARLAFDEDGEHFAFLTNQEEWELDQPSFALYRVETATASPQRVADARTSGVPPGWWVSENGSLAFSSDGARLFFGTAPRPEPESDEKVLDEDRVRLDIWNWRDAYLQPMQLVRADEERDRTYLAVAHADRPGVVQLGSEAIPNVERTDEGHGDYALGTTDVPYRQELSWDGRYQDAYAIDVRTGERRRLVERVRGFGGASLSPDGSFAYWWDEVERGWKSAPMDGSSAPLNLTANIPTAFHDELDDRPQGPGSYGSPVWVEEDAALLVYDKHDVWATDPTGARAPRRLTDGREANRRYRVIAFDDDDPGRFFGFGGGAAAVEEGELLLSMFDLTTRGSGFARAHTDGDRATSSLLSDEMRFGRPAKAEDSDRLVWTRESFTEFPDLWVSDLGFENQRKVSDVNPQQSDYRWGTAELVSWMSNDRTPLEGILIKPDGFDPNRKYPMMVYFYERMSDGLHNYNTPVPNRASVRFSFYASRGYVVFVPDIPYEIGYPGESALDAVTPGVLSLIERGFVDPDRIGVQGHSWGGYQIAYMITKTNLFAAAEAGAPVSNMTSAYGGIRWQTGMSRMFQYERTQSRIGGTLWEERDRYVHNSPVFFADKIQTPLLMLHNDEDGAVPWYQGIEMFVAMRRLGLPVFMLNYNGEGHGLGRQANQEDWAIRMQQFFDHYLIDAPAPEWMADGVPAVVKGRDLGLDLVEETVSEESGVTESGGGSGR
ncbi:MAG: prolyl oligopeptidase family serine peptidase [Gemmatimonadetes bacterium]|nr:prolyl oligopeptidase family serine peptidase [Gemmatimonadota bacterium]